jgi:hypothetical protein
MPLRKPACGSRSHPKEFPMARKRDARPNREWAEQGSNLRPWD